MNLCPFHLQLLIMVAVNDDYVCLLKKKTLYRRLVLTNKKKIKRVIVMFTRFLSQNLKSKACDDNSVVFARSGVRSIPGSFLPFDPCPSL